SGSLTITTGNTVFVSGTLKLTDGYLNGGTVVVDGGVETTAPSGGSTRIELIGDATRTINLNWYVPEFYIDAPNVTVVASGLLIFSEELTLVQGSMVFGSYDVTVSKTFIQSGGTITDTSGPLSFSGAATFSGGSFSAGTGAITYLSALIFSGGLVDFGDTSGITGGSWTTTVVISGGTVTSTANVWSLGASGNPAFDIQSAASWIHNGGTLALTHNSNGTPYLNTENGVTTTFGGLTIATAGFPVYTNAGDNIEITGDLTISGGNLLGSANIALRGDFIHSSAAASTQKIEMIGDADQGINISGGSGAAYDGDLTINKSGGKVTVSSTITFNASNQDFIVTSGTLDTNGYSMTVSGSGGLFTFADGITIRMRGGESLTTPSFAGTVTGIMYGTGGNILNLSYTDLIINGDAGSVFPLTSDLSVANDLSITSGSLFTNGSAITVSGVFSNDGTLQLVGGEDLSFTNDTDSGTVEYIGDGDGLPDSFTLVDIPYYNLIVSTTDATDTISSTGTIIGTLTDGLELYWTFDETSTGATVADSSVNGNDGAPAGATGGNNKPQPSTNVPSVNFSDPRSLDFDGTDDEVVISAISQLPASGDISVAYWAYREGSPHDAFAITADVGTNVLSPFGWYNNSFNFGNGSTYQYPITVTLGATQNTWVHLVFVLDTVNNKLRQYVNGTSADNITTTIDPSPLNTSEFRVGRGSFSDSFAVEFDGKIDDMRVYSRALTADEAASLASGDNDNGSSVSITNVDVNGSLTIQSGTFNAPSGTLYIAGDFTNNGTYIHDNGTVVLDGGNQTIEGATTFYNITKNVTSPYSLTFPAGVTNVVSATTTFTGTSGNLLTLQSSSAGSPATITFEGIDDFSYLNVIDITNNDASSADCFTGCVDGEGNTGWAFTNNIAPTLTSLSASAISGINGPVTISQIVDDADDDNLQLIVEYRSGDCSAYSSQSTTTLSSTVTATNGQGSITVDNNDSNGRQVQVIDTASGANTVGITWQSKLDEPTGNGGYCVFVTPYDGVESGTTVSTTVSLDNVSPTAPGDLTIVSTSTDAVEVSFGSASVEPNFAEYKIFYKQGSSGVTENDTGLTSSSDANLGSRTYNGASTTTISGLSSATHYVMNIFAYDTNGNTTTASSEISFYTLADPVSSLAASNATDTSTLQFSLSFTATNQTGIRIDRDNGCDDSFDVTLYDSSTALLDSPLVTSTNITANTCYVYRFQSYNDDGVLNTDSVATTNQITSPPGQPQNVTAVNTDSTEILWGWDAVTGATSYNVYSSPTGTLLGTVSSPTVQLTVSGLNPNATYGIVVRAVHSTNGEGIASSEATTVTDASIPSNLSQTNQTATAMRWTWDNDGQASFFARDKNNTSDNSGITTNPYWDQGGLSANTAYTLAVRARNSEGQDTSFAELTRYTSQNDPTGISFSGVGSDTLTITAGGSFPNNGVASSFIRFTNSTISTVQDVTSGQDWTQTGLSPNTPYIYTVTAFNGDGDQTAISTSSAQYTLATTPSQLTIGDTITSTTLYVTINTNGNPTSTTYALYSSGNEQYIDADGLFTDTPVYQTTSTWGSSIAVTGLSANTWYRFQAAAKNAVDEVTSLSTITDYVFTDVATSTYVVATTTSQATTGGYRFIVADGYPGSDVNLQDVDVPSDITDTEDVSIDFTRVLSANTVVIGQELVVTRDSGSGIYYLTIPAGTIITAGSGWNGQMLVPTVRALNSVSLPSGQAGDIEKVIEIGFSGIILTLSQAAKIVLPGQTGTTPAFSSGESSSVISTECLSASDSSNISGDGECYFDDGTDMIIWTKHFTDFFVFTPDEASADSANSSSGGGGGSASFISRGSAQLFNNVKAILINNGDRFTRDRRVKVLLNVLGIESVAFSYTPDFAHSSYIPFSSLFDITLSAEQGLKNIYVKFRSYTGQTVTDSASITYIPRSDTPVDQSDVVVLPDIDPLLGKVLEKVPPSSDTPIVDDILVDEDTPIVEPSVEDSVQEDPIVKKETPATVCPLAIGSAYKIAGSPGIYYIDERTDTDIRCQKRIFLNSTIYFSHFDSWNDVKLTTSDILEKIPFHSQPYMPYGPKLTIKEGDLLKTDSRPEVYLI
ncbi:MAG: hypothetical protein COU30_02735, partial [Candidatus Magasanikbacteria bacterium CG10_big_fil_rev_8_21_14_0_10_38_6]